MKFKLIPSLVLVVLFSACQQKHRENLESESQETWGLIPYFDSIETNKSVAAYSLLEPAWFALVLEVDGDSLWAYGSIGKQKLPYHKNADTLARFNSSAAGGDWVLRREMGQMLLQKRNGVGPVYTYRRREDLNLYPRDSNDFWVVGKQLTRYFNAVLLSGKFQNLKDSNAVEFGVDGKLSGWPSFSEYKVRNYFGTLHPHRNLDVVYLLDPETKTGKDYHWQWSSDTLSLTPFVEDSVEQNGQVYVSDDRVPRGESIRFLRK